MPIKPCPFCGSKRVKVYMKNSGTKYINELGHRIKRKVCTVRCNSCSARGSTVGGLIPDRPISSDANVIDLIDTEDFLREEAIRKWNERECG